MTNNIFDPKRRLWEYLTFASVVPAIVVLCILKPYWYIPDIKDNLNGVIRMRLDSLLELRDLSFGDIVVRPSIIANEETPRIFVDAYGAFNTAAFLDTADAHEYLYKFSIRKVDPFDLNFNLGGNNVGSMEHERKQTRNNDSLLLLDVWFNKFGDIEEISEFVDAGFPAADSISIFRYLCDRAPPTMTAAVDDWRYVRHNNADTVEYKGRAGVDDGMFERTLTLSAEKAAGTAWKVSWKRVVTLIKPPPAKAADGGPTFSLKNVAILFLLIAIVLFIGVFIVRLRKDAVNIGVCLAAAAALTIYIVAVTVSLLWPPIPQFLIMVFFVFVFVGFFLTGMPMAGLYSLARETFAARFYTSVKLLQKPWKSMYIGRSLLIGISAAITTTALLAATAFALAELGLDGRMRHMLFDPQMLYIALFPVGILALSLTFLPMINVASLLVVPVISYRYLPPSRRLIAALFGFILAAILFSLYRVDNLSVALIFGVITGVVSFLVFYKVDLLALFMYSFFAMLVAFTPYLFVSAVPMVITILAITAVVGLGIIAYSNKPHKVVEDDYKPDFLWRIEDKKRVLRELEAAKSVQQRLLPTILPSLPRVQVAATCIPAFEVGGDYYDFFTLDERRLGILIGDVSGKGMSAAFYITLAKGVIVSQVRRFNSPSDVLQQVNDLLYGVMERGKFVSMIYGILDTETNEFSYANAGHNPLIVRRNASGKSEMIQTRGMAIGLDSGKIFGGVVQTHSVQLETDDIVVLYTDGVTEARNREGGEYSDERLLSAIETSAPNAEGIIDTVLGTIRKFVGRAPQNDDITLIAIQSKA